MQMDMIKKLGQQYLDKIGFKTKGIKRDKEGHYIILKGEVQQENVTVVNLYAPNIGAPKYSGELKRG